MSKVAAYDFPVDAFPITIRAMRTDNNEKVWEEVIEAPPVVLQVPPLAKQLGVEVRVEVQYHSDGDTRTEVTTASDLERS